MEIDRRYVAIGVPVISDAFIVGQTNAFGNGGYPLIEEIGRLDPNLERLVRRFLDIAYDSLKMEKKILGYSNREMSLNSTSYFGSLLHESLVRESRLNPSNNLYALPLVSQNTLQEMVRTYDPLEVVKKSILGSSPIEALPSKLERVNKNLYGVLKNAEDLQRAILQNANLPEKFIIEGCANVGCSIAYEILRKQNEIYSLEDQFKK